MSRWILDHLWLIPVVPFAVSLVILSLPNGRHKSAAVLAVAGQIAALVMSFFAFLRCDARVRYFEQLASSVHLLGVGWTGVLFAHWILDGATKRRSGGKKSVRYHSHRRPGIFPWPALALRPQRHASLLRRWGRL